MKHRKYYGITFPKEFSVAEETKLKFARFLFIHPDISFESVEGLLGAKEKLKELSKLIHEYNCSLTGISPAGKDDSQEMTKLERFFIKLHNWIVNFDIPTLGELQELSDSHLVNLEVMVVFIKIILGDDQFSVERVEAFLKEYAVVLPPRHMDEALDMYHQKSNKMDSKA